jgi:hypothetical protein
MFSKRDGSLRTQIGLQSQGVRLREPSPVPVDGDEHHGGPRPLKELDGGSSRC